MRKLLSFITVGILLSTSFFYMSCSEKKAPFNYRGLSMSMPASQLVDSLLARGFAVDSAASDSGSTTVLAKDGELYRVLVAFTADDKFGSVDQHKLDATQLFRSVYIGDWIYALDAKGNVYSFKPAL